MRTTPEEILAMALELSEADRLMIANHLLATLPEELPRLPEDDLDFFAELERRSGDREGAVSWDELRSQLKRSINN